MSQLHELFEMFTKSSIELFPNATASISLIKLKKEITELESAMLSEDENILDEYVDCVMCLLHSMTKLGFTTEDFRKAFQSKLLINIARTWKENGDGTYSHVKK